MTSDKSCKRSHAETRADVNLELTEIQPLFRYSTCDTADVDAANADLGGELYARHTTPENSNKSDSRSGADVLPDEYLVEIAVAVRSIKYGARSAYFHRINRVRLFMGGERD